MKRIAILQSNYIPWKGYFDLIASVDELIFYDDAQFTKNDWRNRNLIKTPHGPQWLSIPVGIDIHRSIQSVKIADASCGTAHWTRLCFNYRRARCFEEVSKWLQPLYCDAPWTWLSKTNQDLVKSICSALGIKTRFSSSSDYELPVGRTERLVSLCQQSGANVYVSGPGARAYLDVAAFREEDIDVSWFEYTGYPDYPQLWGEFVHEVSIVDLLFNCGSAARSFMKARDR